MLKPAGGGAVQLLQKTKKRFFMTHHVHKSSDIIRYSGTLTYLYSNLLSYTTP